MGTRYTTNTISGYDTTPSGLSDDGSETTGNKIHFADVYSNLSDPVKSLAEAINTDLVNHFDVASDAAKTTTYAVDADDDRRLVRCDATLGAFSVTLGAAATLGNGFQVTIKKTDSSANAVTVDANLSEEIDGALTYVLAAQYDWATLRCDGSNLHVVASNKAPGRLVDIANTTTETTVNPDADTVLMYDDSASANREVLINKISTIVFASGDIILMDGATPNGWTKLTSAAYENTAVRVISTTTAGRTSNLPFTTAMANRTTSTASGTSSDDAGGKCTQAHNHTVDMTVNYCDVFAVQKD